MQIKKKVNKRENLFRYNCKLFKIVQGSSDKLSAILVFPQNHLHSRDTIYQPNGG